MHPPLNQHSRPHPWCYGSTFAAGSFRARLLANQGRNSVSDFSRALGEKITVKKICF